MTAMSTPMLALGPTKHLEPRESLDDLPATAPAAEWPQLPTETELYILPDGQVVVADLPVELSALLANLGRSVPFETELPPADD